MTPDCLADTRPVAPSTPSTRERLGAWLAANVAPLDGPLEIAQFKGGQSNPTYLLAAGRAALRAAAQAARQAAAVGARRRARVPRDPRARRHRRAGGAGATRCARTTR
ncbi:MAG: hypothetical protein MZW92_09715 [Comamonadaceae bacterium]|nr:hypothetical protein [Comamonadaceae bacterium]